MAVRIARPRIVHAPQVDRFATGANTRYLTDQLGAPWFGVGDTAWSLVGQLSPTEITAYLEDRAARGVNLVLLSLLEHQFSDNAPNNYNNDPPFTGTAFQSSLNTAYWTVVDHAVSEADRLGITLLACPAYLGFEGSEEGFDTEIAAASNAQMASYGTALASRYGSARNLMWLIGHDQAPNATEKAREEAMVGNLPGFLTVVGARPTLGTTTWGSTTISVDAETVYYVDQAQVDAGLSAWDNAPRPWLFLEGRYENENSITAAGLRYQQWGSLVSGATACMFGNSPIWKMATGWPAALDDTGSLHNQRFAEFMAGLGTRWAATSADTTGTFLTSGAQTGSTRAGARFGTSLGIAYMPTARSVTLDLTEISAASNARVTRVDPTSGATSVLGTFATSGSQVIASQGNNAAGDSDWALLVEGV